MSIELYIFATIISIYALIITIAIIGFYKLKIKPNSISEKKSNFISIVSSARNEEETIEFFLYEIIKQDFSKNNFELILIDDHSEDNTYKKAFDILETSSLNYQLIKQPNHQGKKKSLALAIEKTRGDVIITTDADVIYRHSLWLKTISNYFRDYNPNMLIMPIDFKTNTKLLSIFQITENIALTGITAGYAGIKNAFMCNGANLAFTKTAYNLVNGYHSHFHILSGDDVFLLEGIKKLNPKLVHYTLKKELIVKTAAITNFSNFICQRIRWASKTRYNNNPLNSIIAFTVVIANLIFLALYIAYCKNSILFSYLLILAITKCVFDFLLLFLAANFIERLKYIWWIVPFNAIYWIYALCIALGSIFYKPTWKEKKHINV